MRGERSDRANRRRIGSIACAAVLLVGAGSAEGCASDPLPVASTTTVDLSNPDLVISNALETMYTWNPTKEDSAAAAYQRAAIYLSGGLNGQAGDTPPPGNGSQWQQWRAVGASVAAKVYLVADETPPNSDTEMHRVVVIVQSATTQDGKLVDEIRHTAWVTANKADNAWRVTNIKL
jgi:hypothetical protein